VQHRRGTSKFRRPRTGGVGTARSLVAGVHDGHHISTQRWQLPVQQSDNDADDTQEPASVVHERGPIALEAVDLVDEFSRQRSSKYSG
jgi:hypothetical protein